MRLLVADLASGELELPEEIGHHVARVLRLARGQRLRLCDVAAQTEADAEILSVDRQRVRVRVFELVACEPTSLAPVVLIQCLPKGDKTDAVVRDATELGVSCVRLATCERSVATLRNPQALQRLQKIALEAARQCGRSDTPRVEAPTALGELLATVVEERRLCLDPSATTHFAEALDSLRENEGVALLVGPEGGLSEAELRLASEAGFTRVRLGRLVMRTETAPVAALGALAALRSR